MVTRDSGLGTPPAWLPAVTHTLEEFKLVKMSSNVPRESRFTNKLRVSFSSDCAQIDELIEEG